MGVKVFVIFQLSPKRVRDGRGEVGDVACYSSEVRCPCDGGRDGGVAQGEAQRRRGQRDAVPGASVAHPACAADLEDRFPGLLDTVLRAAGGDAVHATAGNPEAGQE